MQLLPMTTAIHKQPVELRSLTIYNQTSQLPSSTAFLRI